LGFGAPSYRGGAPNDLNVLAAYPRTTISLALRLVAETIVVTGVSVGVAAISIIAAEAANEAATEPSVGEAATEPSVSDAATEASIAEAAVEASTAEAAVEASAAMETPSPSAASDSWGRRDRKTEGKNRQGSGNRSKERYMHDSLSNP
jgi:hypothetical protein